MAGDYTKLHTLGKRLKWAREVQGYTSQAKLAAEVGVDRHTIMRWENDSIEPSLLSISQLAEVLRVDRGWLAFGDRVPFGLPAVEEYLRSDKARDVSPEQAELMRRHSRGLFPTDSPPDAQIEVVKSLVAWLLRATRQNGDEDKGT